jgi:hypothetical protein
MWTTESIKELSNQVSDRNLKELLREISINSILSNDNDRLKFPFYIPLNGSTPINQFLRASNVPFKMTDEEQKNYLLFKEEPIELFKILKNGSPIRSHEEEIINCYKENRFVLIKSPANRGFTTLISFCALHYSIYNQHKSIAVFTRTYSDKFLKLYQDLPYYLKPGISNRNISKVLNELVFDNMNKVLLTYNPTNAIGRGFDFISLDINSNSNKIIDLTIPSLKNTQDSRLLISTTENLDMNSNYSIFTKIDVADLLRQDKIDKLF